MKQAFYIDSDSHLNLELTCQKNHKLKELKKLKKREIGYMYNWFVAVHLKLT